VMALMLVDHVREFFLLHRQVPDPMRIAETPPELFATRLATHLCAPVFVLLALCWPCTAYARCRLTTAGRWARHLRGQPPPHPYPFWTSR
jgi:hypothetical protein